MSEMRDTNKWRSDLHIGYEQRNVSRGYIVKGRVYGAYSVDIFLY